MKRKLLLLLSTMVFIIVISIITINLFGIKKEKETIQTVDKIKVVTTFYPIYMIGLNLADQIEGMEVKSLTDLNTGCLHDYQLTTDDMKLISSADVLVINGGGMEGFLKDVTENYPKLLIIDASKGISMLPYEGKRQADEESEDVFNLETEEESEEFNLETEEEHDHGNFNPHVWLNPKLYIKQIENVKNGLESYIKASIPDLKQDISDEIEQNAKTYIQKVEDLDQKIENQIQDTVKNSKNKLEGQQAVIFHDSFAYFANRVGMKVAFTVPLDSDTSLSAGDIAKIIDEVKLDQIQYLFTEQQYSDSIAKQIADETDAKVYIIDSSVTGNGDKDSYLKAMNKNLDILIKALK